MGLIVDILSAIMGGSVKYYDRRLDDLERDHPEMRSRIKEEREKVDRLNNKLDKYR